MSIIQSTEALKVKPLLELKQASVHFGSLKVFDGLDLQVKRGECLVLIGPSGQGKTTLIKTLATLITPQKGELLIEQKEVLTLGKKELSQWLKKMGMLFQKNALFDSLSCGENIAFPLRETTSLTEDDIQDKVRHFLEAVGLPHAKDLGTDEISGGMQKRLGIARALALKPEIIFYDDPTAGLDPITSKKIVELILELKNEQGSTVVAITNDMNRAYQLADRIGLLIDGELIITGSPEETKAHQDPRVACFIRGESVANSTNI